ncbi:FAD dependent oxidoreductase-like protein [Trichodelitschia bisporula]|uniref:FAD dependent oxidoreductase-like protein n=1 Tax=Trichodelitschia bisporula TaxID=703511 RepID=A0A6G1HPK7_9PEZI|nr:FAD dependent oxidoreductase-like protein [Trichodelitschia bisporula]
MASTTSAPAAHAAPTTFADPTPDPIPTVPLPVPKPSAPYWLSEPDAFLENHRTTPELPAYADVVVVGSGLTGANAARYLGEEGKGLRVVMLEAREACSGATGRNGGHLQPLLLERPPSVAHFELRNCTTLGTLITSHSIPCAYQPRPSIRTYWQPPAFAAATAELAELRTKDPDLAGRMQALTSPEDLAAWAVKPECVGAIRTEGAAAVWPYKLIAWMLRREIEVGRLNLQTSTPVTSLAPYSGDKPGARWSLSTPRGAITARHVLLATNAWTAHLLPQFAGLIVPVRETMSALIPPPAMPPLNGTYGFVGLGPAVGFADDYLVQLPPQDNGLLMFGGGRGAGVEGSVGEADDAVVDAGCVDYLRRSLGEALALGVEGDLEAKSAWSGIWAASRDGRPWVGGVPRQDGVWLAGAYSGHGMPNGALCARAVVRMILGSEAGEEPDSVVEGLVSRGDLPESYVLTPERMEAAQRVDSVWIQGVKGPVRLKE